MKPLASPPLEDWYRERYFAAKYDISGSGVEDFTLGEIRDLCQLDQQDLDAVAFHDSRTLGASGLRRAIADRFAAGYQEKVMATNGSTEAIFLVMHALLRPGDEVVIIEPCYFAYANLANAIGCRVRPWPLHLNREQVVDMEDARALVGPRTRMVIVNFPHNPTGISISPQAQRELIELVAAVDAYLVWDAAFAHLVYGGSPLPDPGLTYAKTISLGTLSKAYGLPGLRAGWCIASPDVLDKCVVLRDYTTMAGSPLSELIAQRVIEHTDQVLAVRLQQARTNLALVTQWVSRHRAWVSWHAPMGGVTAFLHLPGIEDLWEFCDRLVQRHGVLLVPGLCFNVPGYIRLGFGGGTDTLVRGLALFSQALCQHFQVTVPPAESADSQRTEEPSFSS